MLKPENFQSEEEVILAANLKKIDLLTNTGWAVCIGKHEPNDETIAVINEDRDELETIPPDQVGAWLRRLSDEALEDEEE